MKCEIVLLLTLFSWTNALSCTTPQGETSQCISLYDCPALLSAFEQRPLKSEVVSYLRQSQCGFEGYVPRVCCGPLPVLKEAPSSTSRPSPVPTVSPGQVDPVSSEDSTPSSKCGEETNGDRIYGGQITELDEFPWMALLGYRTKNKAITYQCGGALINHRYVITAAHCVTGEIETAVGKLSTVRLGEYDTQKDVDCLEGVCADRPQELAVHSAYPHSGFSDSNKNRKDDIAVVRLAQRATFTYYVKPICLADNSLRLDDSNDMHVAGWGKTLNGQNSPIKLKLSVPIFNKDKCASKYQTLGAVLTNRQICAGGVFAEDACRGDSGGPLMNYNKREDNWKLVAVVSFGYGCGRDGWPGVYTSIASYRDWILTTLRTTNV